MTVRFRDRIRVTMKSTSTSVTSSAAAPYARASYSGIPLRTPEKMNSGSEFIGLWNGSELKNVEAPETISSGAVSPATRAMPRINDVARPDRAVGSTTRRTVCHRDAPSASPASRRPLGTVFSATSDERAMTGIIVVVSATATANPSRSQCNSMIRVA